MKTKDAFEAVQAIVETVPQEQRSELFELLSVEYSIGAIAVGSSETESESESMSFKLESLLTDEQLAKMTLYREKISKSWEIIKENQDYLQKKHLKERKE